MKEWSLEYRVSEMSMNLSAIPSYYSRTSICPPRIHDVCQRHCNTLQHTATHWNTLEHIAAPGNTLQRPAAHCSTLQHTATHRNTPQHTFFFLFCEPCVHVVYLRLCNILQHTATNCNTLQQTATHCNTLQHTATHHFPSHVSVTSVRSTAKHYNTLQQTATHCSTLQHTAPLDTAPLEHNVVQHTSTHWNTPPPTATHLHPLQHTFFRRPCVHDVCQKHCNTLQHTATQCKTYCNTPQHTATHLFSRAMCPWRLSVSQGCPAFRTVCVRERVYVWERESVCVCVVYQYGVATMSRMLKNTGLFAEYRSLLYSSFAKETYIFKHPTNRSHPIWQACLSFCTVCERERECVCECMCVICQ